MADNASTARPYAKALFELAQESSSFDAWSAALAQLSAVANDDSFNALVNDPRIDRSQLAELLTDISKDQMPQGGDNFIKLLVQNDRLEALADIAQQYGDMVAKAQSSIVAEVITAMALTEAQKSSLAAAMEKRLGLKVTLAETVDATLMGGAIVKAGDLVIDGSAQGRVVKLTTALLR